MTLPNINNPAFRETSKQILAGDVCQVPKYSCGSWFILWSLIYFTKAVTQKCSVKKVFCKISQENTCARVSFLIKLQISDLRLWHRCFPVNFVKFLRTPFFIKDLWWLLLILAVLYICTYIYGTKYSRMN